MIDVSFWGVVVAGISAMVIGGLWYGPLFGKMWMKGQGWDQNDRAHMDKMKKGANKAYAQMFVLALAQAFVLAHVIAAFTFVPDMADRGAWSAGLQSGFWMWLGFVLPVKYGDKLWSGKKFKFVAIDLGYYLVQLLVMGVILASWM